jgi:hypothetical protein
LGLRRLRGKVRMTLQLGSLTLVTGACHLAATWELDATSYIVRGSLRQEPFF